MKKTKKGIVLNIKVLTLSNFQKIYFQNGVLKIKVISKATNNKANQETLIILSKFFEIKKYNILMLYGHKSNKKIILLQNISFEKVKSKIYQCTIK